jgi:hypothetical protein
MSNVYVDRTSTHTLADDPVPVSAGDLAAYVHDLLDARGLNPVLTRESRDAAEHAAALMLAAYGVVAPHDSDDR